MNGLSLRLGTAESRCFDVRMHLNHVFRTLKEDVREVAETDADKRRAEIVCKRLDHQFSDAIQAIDRAELTHREFLMSVKKEKSDG